MCNPKIKSGHGHSPVAHIDGRLVLHPAGNRVAALEHNPALKKPIQKTPPPPTTTVTLPASPSPTKLSPPASPKPKASAAAGKTVLIKRTNNVDLSSSSEKPTSPKSAFKTSAVVRKKSKKSSTTVLAGGQAPAVLTNDIVFLSDVRAPGSIAAAQREQASFLQAQRKMKTAHYGRATSKLDGKVAAVAAAVDTVVKLEEKRCSFITPNSDPLYIAYHDEEWAVPVHDDKMLFELLVLTGAQVGLDWSIILRKRTDFREAFAGFDAEAVARFTEKQIVSISSRYELDLGRVRGFVDNANRVLEVRKEFGSLDKYLWGFVNHKPIATNYKCGRKIPVKTSKSESISKDLVRRGFRFVGPTVVHSFMQAAGLTNDHLTSCPRHLHCSSIASSAAAAAAH